MFCSQCGVASLESDVFCGACGFKHEQPIKNKPKPVSIVKSTKLDISWVFKSIGIFLLTFMVVYLVVGFMLLGLIDKYRIDIDKTLFAVLFSTCNVFVFLIGGFITGYLSPGVTLKEPAIAVAVLATLSNLVTLNIAVSLIVWIFPYYIAYFGAEYGEKLQQARRV